MQVNVTELLGLMETFGEAFPWEKVELTVQRHPAGLYMWFTQLQSDQETGREWAWKHADSPEQAVGQMIADQKDKRDPETIRKKKIAQLKEQIAKLEAVVLGIPPYKPNRELPRFVLPVAKPTIDV